MYVAVIPNRGSPPAILLCESYREGGTVKNRTLANLSHWPPAQIAALRQVLRGATVVGRLADAVDVVALIVDRLLAPGSKLATARRLDPATASHTLGEALGLGAVDLGELYAALDWLLPPRRAARPAPDRRRPADQRRGVPGGGGWPG